VFRARVIAGRKGTTAERPLRVLTMLRARWDAQRAPALQALADLGHEVIYIEDILSPDAYRKVIERLKVDVVLLWGSSLQNFLMSAEGPFFLDDMEVPYATLWTDNPVKHLYLLKDVRTPNHKAQFVPDTQVIAQMEGLGFDNLHYLPPWHIDPEIFRPVPAEPELTCQVGFAATVNAYEAERAKWRNFWDYRMNAAANTVIARLDAEKDHVDVFDMLADEWDPWSLEFSLISHAMYFEQKAIVRRQVIEAMGDRLLDIVGIGSAVTDRPNVHMHRGMEWHELSRFFCSTAVNVNCTPWPKSCHHRVFQATASGAFMITDWRDDAAALYEPDEEVVYFKSLDELPGLIDRYLADEESRTRIAAAGRLRFLSEHTASHRMAEVAKVLSDLL